MTMARLSKIFGKDSQAAKSPDRKDYVSIQDAPNQKEKIQVPSPKEVNLSPMNDPFKFELGFGRMPNILSSPAIPLKTNESENSTLIKRF